VNISLETAGLIESTNRIGVSHLAAETNDRFDFHKPRTVGTMPGVYFNRPDWDKIYSTFASDIRPRIDEMERWEFDITTVRGEQSKLTFSGIKNIPDQYEIYLIDISHHQAINLRQQESYQFSSVNESMSFEIIVGEKNRVAKVLRDVIPSEFILGKNYPNPFNPTTTIPLTLPERSSIRLSIYDIMGRYVRTIFNGVLDPGVFYFEWNGKDHNNQKMSSGIYLYHLKTENGINFTGKMIMIK
jgi:hypothetical protein